MKRFQFSRRDLLKAAGATLCVPAFLRSSFAQSQDRPPNLVLMMQDNGTVQDSFWPKQGEFNSPILDELLSQPELAARTTLLKGINYRAFRRPAGNAHDQGFHGLYSGYDSVQGQGNDKFGGGISIDHTLARDGNLDRPIAKIHCGVHAANYKAINAGRVSFSALGENQHAPTELDIYALYDRVFGSNQAASNGEAAALRLSQQRSVLDAVSGDLMALQQRLGASERQKVDVHLSAVRDFEQGLAAFQANVGSNCGNVVPSQLGVKSTGQGNEENAPALLRLFMEFIANAVACDMVGVLSFQLGRGGEHFHYDWLNIEGMPSDAHDFVAHKDNGDRNIRRINTEIKRWYTSLAADLASRLQAVPAGEGQTALDKSLTVWGNAIATGPHGQNDMPVVLLGGANGRLGRTGFMVDEGGQQHHRLGATLLNIMGIRSDGFGQFPECGVLNGLPLNV